MRKQLQYTALAGMLVLPSFLGHGALVEAETTGKVASKDEVVYATLKANGELGPIYVVNTLDVARAGEILDFGKYESVKNLTDLTELEQVKEEIRLDASEKGKFFYQGNLPEGTELPWDVTVTYLLDGKKVEPADLAGKSGELEIFIETSENEGAGSVFYENYLLQVSLMLPNTYQDIEAADGMIANAGKNKQITFTVMPGQEEKMTVTATVKDFEFDGVQIAAVPSTLPIDTTGTESMTEDMGQLTDAIKQLNDGVAELESGVAELNDGAGQLRDGSSQYKNGIGKLNGSSAELVNASSSIQDALRKINAGLSGDAGQVDLTALAELPAGLTELAAGLKETADGMAVFKENYAKAYGALDGAIKEIPAKQLSEAEIAELYKSGANPATLDKLVASYSAAQKVKGTYNQTEQAFAAVEPSLTQMEAAVREMSGALSTIVGEISTSLKETDLSGFSELQKGISRLSANYGEFHSGLVGYTGGVGELSTSYGKLHAGLVELSDGTGELENGVVGLEDGTTELYEETKDLPEKMQDEIDKMIQEYDKSDFKPVSFVSPKNEKVSSVQFVIKTESIKKAEPETKEAEPEKKKGFWTLLKELFK
ncbi:X-X-X-Leu-X-X-Gly heptad repeat protein [Bacillus tianshenii]|uniref:X-X-X-Leu-X-X-Gly heptad repeat protein n=1 Tax=Sutcliffiella tianshenii TaxID=1463404 RepID=A0ABS2NZ58_9BACI|nr:YhgE/Pip domain-containing protein [Bacillus tianshenii]MBM7619977.1 X-X-X-Leu-X-X-Gly heptad repeat protein [Bacillus tianshenii]